MTQIRTLFIKIICICFYYLLQAKFSRNKRTLKKHEELAKPRVGIFTTGGEKMDILRARKAIIRTYALFIVVLCIFIYLQGIGWKLACDRLLQIRFNPKTETNP